MAERESEAQPRAQKSAIVPLSGENITTCRRFCGSCPSHETCEENEFLFCSSGASDNSSAVAQKGCNCPECEVWMNYGLSSMYFCINGEAQ